MRTSGGGNRDLTMMAVPLTILIVFGVYTGGGVKNVLRMAELTLWAAVEWLVALVS
jgi:hypothetical protein